MAKGKKTGGRQKGSKNRRTLEREMLIGGQITPLEFMLNLMRKEPPPKADPITVVQHEGLRFEAAKAAAPYVHARRAPEDRAGKTVAPVMYVTPNLESDD